MHQSHNSERRRFMKTVGLGTAAAGAAAAVGHVTLVQADTAPAKNENKRLTTVRPTTSVLTTPRCVTDGGMPGDLPCA